MKRSPKIKPFALYAQKGKGPRLHFDGKKFTTNGQAKGFETPTGARYAGQDLCRRYPILRSYRVTVAPAYRKNPSSRGDLDDAARLLEDFSGHEPTKVLRIEDRPISKGLAIGTLDFVGYTTKRDGRTEKYIHRFRKKSRPLLATNSDGTVLRILGGEFQFTEAGIEDR